MKWSRYLLPTLKENPKEAQIISHRLMIRSGMIRMEASGIYSYLPMGVRVLEKIIRIISEEMDRTGALKVLLPIMTPGDLWKKSGRWRQMGPEMMRFKDRHENEFALGPTHEEVITNLVKDTVFSYRDLPRNLYQIHTKFRDEIRPRYGVMRSREFIMKDAYSFDLDNKGLDEHYNGMREAYRKIFQRLGLETIPVEADTGAMGGSKSEEFMILSEIGEETIIFCKECGYHANSEQATRAPFKDKDDARIVPVMERIKTPDVKSIDELAKFFNLNQEHFFKSVAYKADDILLLVVIRGDLEINEVKLKNHLKCVDLRQAFDEEILNQIKMPPGFLGPIEFSGRVVCDTSIKTVKNGIAGAGEKDFHFAHVLPGRDFKLKEIADIHLVKENDPCPKCKTKLAAKPGIELGHIFKLGDKYTKSLNLRVLDEKGQERIPLMGCYGIGVNRALAAIIEQHHDDNGIIWPYSITPFDAGLISLAKSEQEEEIAEGIYQALVSAGWDILMDDRKLSPGIKFKDMDLIGLPIKIILGKKTFSEGMIEIKLRTEQMAREVAESTLLAELAELRQNF